MEKKIKLKTRDNSNNYLEKISSGKYKLIIESEYLFSGFNEDGKQYIDPSGGPMIIVGAQLECKGKVKYLVTDIQFLKGVGTIISLQ